MTNTIAIAPMPGWLLNILFDESKRREALEICGVELPAARKPAAPSNGVYVKPSLRYAEVAFESELQRVRNAREGVRNDTLNKAAFALGQLVGAGVLDEATVEHELTNAALACGLDEKEARKTITSGLRAGMAQPRQIAARNGNGHGHHAGVSDAERQAAEIVGQPEDTSYLIRYPLTDLGNAECLERMFGRDIRYDNISKKWLAWDGQRWAMDSKRIVERLMRAVVRARRDAYNGDKNKDGWAFAVRSENATKIGHALKSAESLETVITTVDEYDADNMLLCAGETTIDLRSVSVRPSARDDLITMRMGAPYDPAATCPTWLRFLEDLFPSRPEMQNYIQRAWGYSLTGDIREQVFFMCHGLGANGKSTFLNTLNFMLGDYAQPADFSTFEADTSEARSDLATFRAARVLTVVENDHDRRLAEGRIKRITGGEKIVARELYAMPFSYRPKFKLWMAMNHKPIIRGADDGIWRRIQFIPFTQSFKGREDKTLEDRLKTELPGILNWTLDGLRAWHNHGLNPPAEVRDATDEYRKESDLVGQWIEQRCMLGVDLKMKGGTAYADYAAWCVEVGLNKLSEVNWSKRLQEKRIERYRSDGKTFYRGIGLKEDKITL
jgi:putative DNA primase/helicase